ncbi:MAG: VWA domain-containing protein [Pseudomonadota bacterium]
MATARRRFNVFSLSFLDVMSCGFGAVVLIFLVINHGSARDQEVKNEDLLAAIRMLDYQVRQGEKDLFELIENFDQVEKRLADSDAKLNSTVDIVDEEVSKLDEIKDTSLAQIESLKALTADVDTREEEIRRLQAQKAALEGQQIREFRGEGDRQYLTGMKVGGRNIVIAVDTSASMLDDTIVNVLRRRNMSDERKRNAPKWRRAIRTVEWIAAQLPLDTEFQIYTFAEETSSLMPEANMDWVRMGEGEALNEAIDALHDEIPNGGSSLVKLMLEVRKLSPIPDNVYLITDGLPTQGENPPRNTTISSRRRLQLYNEAVDRLPRQIPVNVILFPMEGDYLASAAYWQLARITGGAFISPSWDWP